jgi:hypothetical protein
MSAPRAEGGGAAPHPLPLHVRTIRVDAVEADHRDGAATLRVHGTLEDRRPRGVPSWLHHDGDVIHRMTVTLVVSWPDLAITAIDGTMATAPHGVCPAALPSLESLVGVRVGPGFTRAVNERVGRERGCTHVTALILAMGPVVRQGAGVAFGFAPAGPPGTTPWFIDTCQAWREGGPLHREWLRREVDRTG